MASPNVPGDQSSTASHHSDEKAAVHTVPVPPDAELVTAKGNIITKDGVVLGGGSESSFSDNVFEDPEVRAYYQQLYEDSKYECRHVFDATITWTPEEEKALVRKLDWRGKFNSDYSNSAD
jgi:hypothetical protein